MKRTKVLLIYHPTQLAEREARRVDGSLGLLYLAGALERAGIECDVLDANVGTLQHSLKDTFDRMEMQENGLIRIGMTTPSMSEEIARGGYNVVGFSSIFSPQFSMAMEVAKAAKAVSREILVIAGGVNARALASRFFAGGNVDVICNTEGENVIVEIIRAWEQDRRLDVPGTITMQNGLLVNRHPVKESKLVSIGERMPDTLVELDGLPKPAWHKLPWGHYDRTQEAGGRSFLKDPERSGNMQTSRGCIFDCDYCKISGEKDDELGSGGIGKLRFKSEARVFEEFQMLKALGVTKVYIEDDTLLANKPRMRRILLKVRELGLKLADVNGVNLVHFLKGSTGGKPVIDVEFLQLLYDCGLTQIVFPIESASQRLLDEHATRKLNHEKLDVVELVKVARKIGITCPVNMMIGFPDETEEEIMASIDLGRRVVEAGADYCSFKIPVPLPGSKLHDLALRKGHLSPDFNPDIFNWRNAVMQNTAVPPERIEELQQWAELNVNSDEFREQRLRIQIGTRWKSGKGA